MILNPSSGNFSFSAWFNPANGGTTLASQQSGTGTGRVWMALNSNGYLTSNLGSLTALTSQSAISFGSWSYGVVTLAGSTLTLYSNGQSVGTATRTAESATGIFDLGADQFGLFKFNGSLDEVRISTVARSADWIAAEYANQKSPAAFSSTGSPSVAPPTFSPAPGTYTNSVQVTISAVQSATIAYTLNGSGGGQCTTTCTLTLNTSTTITASATTGDGAESGQASATYAVQVLQPLFFPTPGTYSATQTIRISSPTPGASIRYTTDGVTTPTETVGTLYTQPFVASTTTRVKAIAYASGMIDSSVVTATYTFVPPVIGGYGYYRQITINYTPGQDQQNFPLLLSLSDPKLATVANGGRIQNANGYDIIFTSDPEGTNKLGHEVEAYGPTGTLIESRII